MGYDMYLERPTRAQERVRDAAREAESTAYAMPSGPDRDRALDKAWSMTDPTYFRLNIFGMSRYRDAMDRLGMLADDDAKWPKMSPETWGTWMKSGGESLRDWYSERPGNGWFFDPDKDDPLFLDYEAKSKAHKERVPDPCTGILVEKLGSNDGWLVTEAECRAALDAYAEFTSAERKAILWDWDAEQRRYFGSWLRFLRRASKCGGFRVW